MHSSAENEKPYEGHSNQNGNTHYIHLYMQVEWDTSIMV